MQQHRAQNCYYSIWKYTNVNRATSELPYRTHTCTRTHTRTRMRTYTRYVLQPTFPLLDRLQMVSANTFFVFMVPSSAAWWALWAATRIWNGSAIYQVRISQNTTQSIAHTNRVMYVYVGNLLLVVSRWTTMSWCMNNTQATCCNITDQVHTLHLGN